MSSFNANQASKTLKTLLVCAGFATICLMSLGISTHSSPPNTTRSQEDESRHPSSFYSATAEILPTKPTDQDSIQVVVSGEWGNPGFDIAHTLRIENRVITIEATITQKPGFWAQVVTRWQFTQDIGKLSPGSYLVMVNLNGVHYEEPLFVTTAPGERSVRLGDTLKFAFPQAIHPRYGWILKAHDPASLELLQDGFEAPPTTKEDTLLGLTAKVFVFQAIKRGQTKIVFSNCELNASGRCLKELEVQTFNVTIQ